MEFEDSRFAIFADPNAYIQNFNMPDCAEKEIKKIVFQEPYETLSNFYLNNNFTKHDCGCISNKQNNNFNSNFNNYDFNCNHGNKNHNRQQCDCNDYSYYSNHNKHLSKHSQYDNCHNNRNTKQSGFGFDIKSLLPFLGLFNKGGGADLSSLVGLLSNANSTQNQNNSQTENNVNPTSLISSFLSNKDMLSEMLNLFKGGGLNMFSKKQTTKKEIKTTDFEIKNYTRVEWFRLLIIFWYVRVSKQKISALLIFLFDIWYFSFHCALSFSFVNS